MNRFGSIKFNCFAVLVAAILILPSPFHSAVFGQFPATAPTGGPVAIGQAGAQVNPDTGKVAIVQATNTPAVSGGVIQLSAFGWLEPYVDSIVQSLLGIGFAWLMKSKYTQWMDQSARDALETFVKNRANSLIADGAVRMESKSVQVNNPLLYKAANEASTAIPDALKRFGLTPDVVAAKIIDAIPQTTAGAAIVATAHAENDFDPVTVTDRPSASPSVATPNQDAPAGAA